MIVDSGFDSMGQPEIALNNFRERLVKADGQLLDLPRVRSRLGEPLCMSARFGSDSVSPDIRYLNIDVFALREGEYIPVGIYDWEIRDDTANGNKQRHGHLPAVNEAQEVGDRYWATGESFHVRDDDFLKYASENGGLKMMSRLRQGGIIRDEGQWTERIYQGLGIGSLMIAASALILQKLGIREMDLGVLSKLAERPWEKFGRGNRTELEPQEICEHTETEKTLRRFLIG